MDNSVREVANIISGWKDELVNDDYGNMLEILFNSIGKPQLINTSYGDEVYYYDINIKPSAAAIHFSIDTLNIGKRVLNMFASNILELSGNMWWFLLLLLDFDIGTYRSGDRQNLVYDEIVKYANNNQYSSKHKINLIYHYLTDVRVSDVVLDKIPQVTQITEYNKQAIYAWLLRDSMVFEDNFNFEIIDRVSYFISIFDEYDIPQGMLISEDDTRPTTLVVAINLENGYWNVDRRMTLKFANDPNMNRLRTTDKSLRETYGISSAYTSHKNLAEICDTIVKYNIKYVKFHEYVDRKSGEYTTLYIDYTTGTKIYPNELYEQMDDNENTTKLIKYLDRLTSRVKLHGPAESQIYNIWSEGTILYRQNINLDNLTNVLAHTYVYISVLWGLYNNSGHITKVRRNQILAHIIRHKLSNINVPDLGYLKIEDNILVLSSITLSQYLDDILNDAENRDYNEIMSIINLNLKACRVDMGLFNQCVIEITKHLYEINYKMGIHTFRFIFHSIDSYPNLGYYIDPLNIINYVTYIMRLE